MARVNITVPDDVLTQAKGAGLQISRLATAALQAELERRTKVRELEAYLDELRAAQGPVSPEDERAAEAWVDRLEPPPPADARQVG